MFCRLSDLLIGTRVLVVVSENRIAEGTSHPPTPARPEALWCTPSSDDACKAFARRAACPLFLLACMPLFSLGVVEGTERRPYSTVCDVERVHLPSRLPLLWAGRHRMQPFVDVGITRVTESFEKCAAPRVEDVPCSPDTAGPCELQEQKRATQLMHGHQLDRDTGRDLRLPRPLPRRVQWCAS